MKAKIIFTSVILISLICVVSCKKNDEPPQSNGGQCNYKDALYISVESNNKFAILVVDVNTMQLLEVFETPYLTSSIEVTDDGKYWYLLGAYSGGGATRTLTKINSQTGSIINEIETNYSSMVLSDNSNMFFLYNWWVVPVYPKHPFVDKNTLEIIYEDSITGVTSAAFSPNNTLFLGKHNEVIEYDINDFTIIRKIPISTQIQTSFTVNDISFSKDAKFLFLTEIEHDRGPFIVINLDAELIDFIHNVGSTSKIALSPNGKYLYISDPAGYGDDYPIPTNKIFRYDVQSKSMDIFINGGDELGLMTNHMRTRELYVSNDNQFLYIHLTMPKQTIEGDRIDIMKISTETGELVNYFASPEEWTPAWILDMRLRKYRIWE